MSEEELCEEILDYLDEGDWDAADDIIGSRLHADDLVFDQDTVFLYVYSIFYNQSLLGVVESGLAELVSKLKGDASNFDYHCSYEHSFLGSLFHTSFTSEEILSFMQKGASPLNPKGDIYLGAVLPIMNESTKRSRKEWGLKLLSDNFSEFLNETVLGKVIPDSFIPGQQRCLWKWSYEGYDDFEDWQQCGKNFMLDVELLLSYSADINAKSDEEGHTGAMRAAMTWMPEALEFLILKGADVNLTNNMNNTALMYTSGYLPDTSPMNEIWDELPEHLQIARILVEAGADISLKNNRGDTAIDLARKNKNTAVLEYLESL